MSSGILPLEEKTLSTSPGVVTIKVSEARNVRNLWKG